MDSNDVIALRKKLNLTQDAFAQLIGVSKNTIYNYEDGKKIPDSKVAILNKLMEEPAVYETKKNHNNVIPNLSETSGAPYYDVDFIGGFDLVVNDQTIRPSFYIDYPPYNDVDCWINVTGKSMSPFISHGDLVALKKVENWKKFLLLGEIYAIVTEDFRTIKIVAKSDQDGFLKLIPYSKSKEFSEQDIPLELVKQVYRVKGSIKKFF